MPRIAEDDISKGIITQTWLLRWKIGTITEKENGKSKLIAKKHFRLHIIGLQKWLLMPKWDWPTTKKRMALHEDHNFVIMPVNFFKEI